MKKNVGGCDRMARIILGLVLLSFLFVLDGAARWFGLIGIVPLLTGLLSFCPAYCIVGINTGAGCCGGDKAEGEAEKSNALKEEKKEDTGCCGGCGGEGHGKKKEDSFEN